LYIKFDNGLVTEVAVVAAFMLAANCNSRYDWLQQGIQSLPFVRNNSRR
jgi:hypothetical protein